MQPSVFTASAVSLRSQRHEFRIYCIRFRDSQPVFAAVVQDRAVAGGLQLRLHTFVVRCQLFLVPFVRVYGIGVRVKPGPLHAAAQLEKTFHRIGRDPDPPLIQKDVFLLFDEVFVKIFRIRFLDIILAGVIVFDDLLLDAFLDHHAVDRIQLRLCQGVKDRIAAFQFRFVFEKLIDIIRQPARKISFRRRVYVHADGAVVVVLVRDDLQVDLRQADLDIFGLKYTAVVDHRVDGFQTFRKLKDRHRDQVVF